MSLLDGAREQGLPEGQGAIAPMDALVEAGIVIFQNGSYILASDHSIRFDSTGDQNQDWMKWVDVAWDRYRKGLENEKERRWREEKGYTPALMQALKEGEIFVSSSGYLTDRHGRTMDGAITDPAAIEKFMNGLNQQAIDVGNDEPEHYVNREFYDPGLSDLMSGGGSPGRVVKDDTGTRIGEINSDLIFKTLTDSPYLDDSLAVFGPSTNTSRSSAGSAAPGSTGNAGPSGRTDTDISSGGLSSGERVGGTINTELLGEQISQAATQAAEERFGKVEEEVQSSGGFGGWLKDLGKNTIDWLKKPENLFAAATFLSRQFGPDAGDLLREELAIREEYEARERERQNENRNVGGLSIGMTPSNRPLKDMAGREVFDQGGSVGKHRYGGLSQAAPDYRYRRI